MTPTDPTPAREPVTLDEQIAEIARGILRTEEAAAYFGDCPSYAEQRRCFRAVLAILQQHKRAQSDDLHPSWEYPIGDEQHQRRDILAAPYDRQERRAAQFLREVGVGGGDDPVGFLVTSIRFSQAMQQQDEEEHKRAMAEYRKTLEYIGGQAGTPDAAEACRQIIATCKRALAAFDTAEPSETPGT